MYTNYWMFVDVAKTNEAEIDGHGTVTVSAFQCGPMIDINKMFPTETSLGTW